MGWWAHYLHDPRFMALLVSFGFALPLVTGRDIEAKRDTVLLAKRLKIEAAKPGSGHESFT